MMVKTTAPITYHLGGDFCTIEAGTRLRLVDPASLPSSSAVRVCYDKANKKDWRGREWSVVERSKGHLLVVLRAKLRRAA